jgi:hypothetical protein
MKSPALELALRPVRARQEEAMKLHGEAGRCWCDDTTIAALSVLLLRNPRGLLMARDELAGWLCGFERRSGGRAGSEVARWLEVFGGRPLVVDRKTGVPPVVHVPRAAVSVTGGIQPAVLKRALVREYFENGLAARLLLAYPPRRVKKWTEAEVDREVEARLDEVFRRLYALEPELDERGEPCPQVLGLTDEAKAAWIGFYGEHAEEQVAMTGDLAAAWSKLEGYAARLALVVDLVRRASGESAAADGNAVDAESVRAGVALVRWFGHEARRIYTLLGESEDDAKQRRLVELIERHGGAMTVRELQRSSSSFSTAEAVGEALDSLAARGLGAWVTLERQHGPPRREFRLLGPTDDPQNAADEVRRQSHGA